MQYAFQTTANGFGNWDIKRQASVSMTELWMFVDGDPHMYSKGFTRQQTYTYAWSVGTRLMYNCPMQRTTPVVHVEIADPHDTIQDVKNQLKDDQGIPVDEQ
jgi:hypothetical protein